MSVVLVSKTKHIAWINSMFDLCFNWVQILTLTGFLGWEITNQYYRNTYIEFFSRNCSAICSRNIIMKNNHPNKVLSSWRNLSLLLHTKQQSMYSNLVTLVNRLKLNLHVYTRTKNKFWQNKQFHNLLKSLGLFVFP